MSVTRRGFDFIVVGAGTAGCLMANRLSREGRKSVLLLEAGRKEPWWVRVPVGYLHSIGNPNVDWMYQTESEDGLGGRRLRYPRGRVMGGCSAINGMIYMRGQSRDYDGWAHHLQDASWKWDNVLPLFLRHEDHWRGPDPQGLHRSGGEVRVDRQRLSWDVLEAFSKSAQHVGIPAVQDFNRGTNFGVSYFEVNQVGGKRQTASHAFLGNDPQETKKKFPSLTLETNAWVHRLLIGGGQCEGVEMSDGSKRLLNPDGGQLIVCSGAVGSVALLEHSGIGDPTVLDPLGIRCILESPHVGKNLQDHLQLRLVFRLRGPNVTTLNTQSSSWVGRVKMAAQYLFSRSGPLSMAPSQLGAFAPSTLLKTPPQPGDQVFPNLQYHVQPLSLDAFGQPLHPFNAMTASVCNLNPTSRGTIHISSKDPSVAPSIRPNYLSTEEDRRVAADAIRLTREIMAAPPMKSYQPEEMYPGTSYQTEEELVTAAGKIGTTIFHPTCTLAMGKVVDSKLSLKGLSNVKIADASVMPFITSGNTNAPTLMIAEKLAQDLLSK